MQLEGGLASHRFADTSCLLHTVPLAAMCRGISKKPGEGGNIGTDEARPKDVIEGLSETY